MTRDRREFAESIAMYVAKASDYDQMDKRQAILAAIDVLTGDIGAAQEFCYVIGLKVDLFEGAG